MSSSGVEEPLQLQVEYDTLVNSLTELQGKHSGQCVKHEAIRAVLERVGSCEGKQEEEALLGECQALRQDLITAQESYNNAAKALNTALAYRTSLIMDIDSVAAQERECVQATARIKQQSTGVQCTHARKEVAELRAGEERRRQQLETRDQALRAMAEEVERVQGPHAEATQHLRSTEEAKAKLDRQQADKEALLEHRLALVQKKHDMVSGHQQRLEDALARLRHDNAFARATAREATENVARLRAELRAISAATTRAATGSARGRADTHTRVEGSSGCNRHSNSSGGNKDSNGNYGNSYGSVEEDAGGSSGQGTKRGRPAVAATASSAFDVDASSLSFALVDEGRAEMARRQAAIGNLHAALHASTTAITKIKAQLDRVVARTAGAIASAT
ncbi:hypothetical protein PTSG_04830 [Salpingoeca rosetta]|uniref:Uncharacterized protein n=1 Tax=Salpingoeca rosetta (strain ATCC 50818 / BSB-021) TaxID=946362 RepID=F2U9T9_SALR5|nr:uncharacterized protein PTSG_04830 [Salpingoeca rosetta]EGD73116.1 hypothetical protein PTSG_04830 [Salpingoeca rosetta]|eukprot:XP_004994147.1 hypothetical protein PTSG_04830 [Salpingoeca rosetta]